MKQVKPITLIIDDELWHQFKSTINRDRTLNQAIVDLIKEHIVKYHSNKTNIGM